MVLTTSLLVGTGWLRSPPQAEAPVATASDAPPLPPAFPAPRCPNGGYWQAAGARIVDERGMEVVVKGLNWFGLETDAFAPFGLLTRRWTDILDPVAALGFDALRLPFSNELLDPGRPPPRISAELNPDLAGLSGLEVLDKIVEGAGERCLKVILDRHRPDSRAQSALWYTDRYSEARWIADWQALAARYLGNDTVIGFDLHNEPHGAATWGSGDPATDWRLAAERAGDAVLAVNPRLLIIVQGVQEHGGRHYWWGGNLAGVREAPVRLSLPGRLVYSTHDYGPGVFNQPWFAGPAFPTNLEGIWDQFWGYLVREGTAPVFVGEFGGRSLGADREGVWQRRLVAYLKRNRIGFAYWTLNPESGDTGGLLLDDWLTLDQAKVALLLSE